MWRQTPPRRGRDGRGEAVTAGARRALTVSWSGHPGPSAAAPSHRHSPACGPKVSDVSGVATLSSVITSRGTGKGFRGQVLQAERALESPHQHPVSCVRAMAGGSVSPLTLSSPTLLPTGESSRSHYYIN